MNKKQQKLLDSILARVPHDGWTAQAFTNGAKAAQVSPADARKLFPNGVADVVDAFHASIDDAMHAALKGNRKFAGLCVRDKITFAVRARLEAIVEHRDAMRGLLVWSLLPKNIRKSAAQLWRVADAIWVAAGDTSTDYSHYTKRVLLIAVIKSTLAFWLADTSPNSRETWAFLDRRIDDVMKLGKGIGVIKAVGISDIASFVRSKFAA